MVKIAIALLIFLAVSLPASSAEIWLFRGLLGHIYSTGLDDLGQRLKRNGHKVHVLPHGQGHNAYWQIRNSGSKSIALIGHSMGGRTAVKLARRLNKTGVRICLITTIDPVGSGLVPANVLMALNWWQDRRFSKLTAGTGFRGLLRNFEMTGWRHIDLDEAKIIHNRIATVLGSRCQ